MAASALFNGSSTGTTLSFLLSYLSKFGKNKKFLQQKIYKINKRGGPNKSDGGEGGVGGSDLKKKIERGGRGRLFGT